MKNIFVSGSVAYDEIMDFPHHFKDYFHPEKLHQINVSFAVSNLAKHLGGCATNISYALRNTIDFYVIPVKTGIQENHIDSRLRGNDKGNGHDPSASSGRATIYPVAAVGRDGGELLEFFKKNNIDTSFVQQDEKLYTATGKVITDKNDNQIWGFYYGAARLIPKLEIPKKGDSSLDSRLRGNDKGSGHNKEGGNDKASPDFWILSATHEKPFANALQYVLKNKLPNLFDPGMTLTWIRDDLLRKGVMNATYVVGNDYEIAMIEKRLKMTVREIAESGVNVITTLGKKGVRLDFAVDSVADLLPASALSQHENPRVSGIPLAPRHLPQGKDIKTFTIKAIKVKKVVDPTGAGDAWRGGFVGALVSGKTIGECLVMGNVMASFAVETVGTVEYKANRSEIMKRIQSISK